MILKQKPTENCYEKFYKERIKCSSFFHLNEGGFKIHFKFYFKLFVSQKDCVMLMRLRIKKSCYKNFVGQFHLLHFTVFNILRVFFNKYYVVVWHLMFKTIGHETVSKRIFRSDSNETIAKLIIAN